MYMKNLKMVNKVLHNILSYKNGLIEQIDNNKINDISNI